MIDDFKLSLDKPPYGLTQLELRVYAPWDTDGVHLQLVQYGITEHARYVGEFVQMHKVDEAAAMQPLFTLTPESAQKLADSLWDQGIRPRGAQGSLGQLGAVQKHLEDMRMLAFSKVLK